jgi:hypothetical protein
MHTFVCAGTCSVQETKTQIERRGYAPNRGDGKIREGQNNKEELEKPNKDQTRQEALQGPPGTED